MQSKRDQSVVIDNIVHVAGRGAFFDVFDHEFSCEQHRNEEETGQGEEERIHIRGQKGSQIRFHSNRSIQFNVWETNLVRKIFEQLKSTFDSRGSF
jgi:hypothetical protein